MKTLLTLALLAAGLHAQVKDASPAAVGGAVFYVNLPTASSYTNRSITVTDCLTQACTVGGGSFAVVLTSNGTSWYTAGAASGGATTSQQLTDMLPTLTNGTTITIAAGSYRSNTAPFAYAGTTISLVQLTAVGACTAANPMVCTYASVPTTVLAGNLVSISGATGTGCSGMNTVQTVQSTTSTTITYTYNNTGCTNTSGTAIAGRNTSATGAPKIYLNSTGNVIVSLPAAQGLIATCTGSCIPSPEDTPTVVSDGFPIVTGALTGTGGGNFASIVDDRAAFSALGINSGFGIDVTPSGGSVTVSANTSIVPDLTANNAFLGLNTFGKIGTANNCSSAASPAVCASAAAGSVVVAAAGTSVVVNTTAVTANSQIFVIYDSSLGSKLSVTCNATEPALYGVTARTAATSFTISSSTPITDPACFSYFIVN